MDIGYLLPTTVGRCFSNITYYTYIVIHNICEKNYLPSIFQSF